MLKGPFGPQAFLPYVASTTTNTVKEFSNFSAMLTRSGKTFVMTFLHFKVYLHLEPWVANTTLVDFKISSVIKGKSYRFGLWITQIDCVSFNVLKGLIL